jgi:hypothetical protein
MGSQSSCHISSFEQLAAHLPLQAADLPCHWSSMKAFTLLMNKRREQLLSNMGMDQYLLIPFLVG